jgi:uncharacterized protein
MPLLTQRIARGVVPALDATRPPADRAEPDRIVMGVRPGHAPSPQPPVRIFLGTERGQFRAERTFLWSIEKHRDPGRVYEIHLMKHLTGFRDAFWLTAFTNYRFAIPGFCGYRGRAIYNDVDQVYVADPGELYDLDMEGAGFLSINDRDTSVMLIDCERMARVWTAQAARRQKRRALEAVARESRLWGRLAPGWNARDREYDPHRSKLVHFTTLHTQPWRPFPEHFVYFENPTGDLWCDLEAAADRAGFMPFVAERPSSQWQDALARLGASTNGRTLAQALAGGGSGALRLRGALEQVPDDDLPWVLDRLFAQYVELDLEVVEPVAASVGLRRRPPWFWQQQLERSALRHPQTRWQLLRRCGLRRHRLVGGPAPPGPVVALLHRKPGHDHQSLALASRIAALTGRSVREHRIPWSTAGYLMRRCAGGGRLSGLPADAALLVAAGWLPTRAARRNAAGARLALLGRKAGRPPATGGCVVQCRHFGLPWHPSRMSTLLPLNAGVVAPTQLRERWRKWETAPRRVAALVGGQSRSHRLTADDARAFGRAASNWARRHQARLLVVTSRRTGAVARHVGAGLAREDDIYVWQPGDAENPYALALDAAEAVLVTGESESMLADAVANGLPVLIWPLQRRRATPWAALSAWVAGRACRAQYNRRGSIRPQQGFGYLCARILERGWALPPRDLEALHDALYSRSLAARFGEPERGEHPPAFQELEHVSHVLAARLGLAPALEPDLVSNGALHVLDRAS